MQTGTIKLGHGKHGREVALYDAIPDGWKIEVGANSHPRGYVWITNGKSLFSGRYKHGLIDGMTIGKLI